MIRARVMIARCHAGPGQVRLTWRIREFGRHMAGAVVVPEDLAERFERWLRAGAVWLRNGERFQ